ncbi:MAG TPA: hypothetical protein VEA41_12890 [Salinarimonas sp.]|nr:hypothetical protein [Salinarimonas sp.]
MKRNLAVIAALILVVTAVPAFASHGWSTYHWSRSCGTCPKSLTIYDTTVATTRANWPDHLRKSVFGDPNNPNSANRLGWNDSVVLTLSITGSTASRSTCAAVAGAVRVCNYPYGTNGWLGLAQIWLSSGHISQGTTKVNDTYFNSGYPITEQRHVMCQEVGHDFGLGHTSENGSSQNTCMDYYQNTSNSDWTSTGPNSHDFYQLEVQHHWGTSNIESNPNWISDVMTEQARVPVFLEGVELTEPWQWGTPTEFGPDGTPVTYFLKTGPNHNDGVLTHIYPARELMAPEVPRTPELDPTIIQD